MVSASNIFNQVIEKDLDALMSRTKNRPLPNGEISVNSALIIGFIFVIIGWIKGLEFISCLLYTSPSPRDRQKSRMPSSA